jgi:antitoxin FitA
MANISIRKLDEKIYNKLCMRAANHGVSMEEEVRQIISNAVAAPINIGAVFRKHFGIQNGIDLQELSNRPPHEPMDL